MRDQQVWDDQFVLHNFVFQGVVIGDDGPVQIVREPKLGFVEELADLTKNVEIEAPAELPVDAEIKETPPQVSSLLKNSPNKIDVYCLPATVKVTRDELYDEVTTKVTYQDPFLFEGVIVYGDDMSLSIWSPTDAVKPGSVLFPKNRDKRWWKVVSAEPNMEGWMLNTTVTDYQPQFRV